MTDQRDEPPNSRPKRDAPQQRRRVADAKSESPSSKRSSDCKSEEAAANRDRYLRAVAEAENFKKRLQKDKSDGDPLRQRNAASRPPARRRQPGARRSSTRSLGGNGKSVVEGVELTLRLFRDVLERHGVKELGDPNGAAFDPSTQEAAEVQTTSEFRQTPLSGQQIKGYRYNDRLLRPARVVVATGVPSSSDAEPARTRRIPSTRLLCGLQVAARWLLSRLLTRKFVGRRG